MDFIIKKRERSQNWDVAERTAFLILIKQELYIIENKKKITVLNKDKLAAWERISRGMEVHGFVRDGKRLREQWQRMKVQAKKNISQYRKKLTETGGGPPVLEPSDTDWLIKDMLPQEFTEEESRFDSDTVLPEKVFLPENKQLPTTKISEIVPLVEDTNKSCSNYLSNVDIVTLSGDPETEEEQEDANNDNEEEIHIVFENPATPATPKARKEPIKKMSVYEEKLYELNVSRINQLCEQARELHELRMMHEWEYHNERMRLLRKYEN
ncbi:apontic [Holotrichia oblita]|uniref:Apontic n=1 Tax=Holotrichia oblita TaxID=644536 RepID=A0ACB9T8N3_HOLOL|nr:apontic [Holotrichia oblita]